jgi:hypothetical protein
VITERLLGRPPKQAPVHSEGQFTRHRYVGPVKLVLQLSSVKMRVERRWGPTHHCRRDVDETADRPQENNEASPSSVSSADAETPIEAAPSSVAPVTTKPCPVCGELIKISARKCIHCSSDLDWRRYLGLSSTTLAVLTALIAVIGTVAPTVRTALEPKDSRLHLSFVGAGSIRSVMPDGRMTDGDTIILATNDGTKAGAIVAAGLLVSWKTRDGQRGLRLALWTPNDDPIIVPAATAVAGRFLNDTHAELLDGTSAEDAQALMTPAQGSDPMTAPFERASCLIGLTIINASGRTTEVAIPARCSPFHPTLRAAVR